jgi:opacity protein-like surface antigen
MTMGRTVALAAAMVLVSVTSGNARDDIEGEIQDDVQYDTPDEVPEEAPEVIPEEVPEVVPEEEPEEVEEVDYSRNGIFVGLGGSYGVDTFENDADTEISRLLDTLGYTGLDLDLDVDNSLGMNGRVGYRLHPHFSVELKVEWLDGFDTDVDETAPVIGEFTNMEIEPWVITGGMKAHLLTGRYQPYLTAGGGVMTINVKLKESEEFGMSDSERLTDFTLRFGGGIDFYATENIVLTVGVDYVLPIRDVKDFDYVSIGWGLEYRF